jgi:hypothetical protein
MAIVSDSHFHNLDGLVKFTKTLQGTVSFVNCTFSGNTGVSARVFNIENNLVRTF